MAREVKILIPDDAKDDTVDIKVISKGKEIVNYRLEILEYKENETNLSRADFVKQELDSYSKNYEIMDVGLDDEQRIPVLYRNLVE